MHGGVRRAVRRMLHASMQPPNDPALDRRDALKQPETHSCPNVRRQTIKLGPNAIAAKIDAIQTRRSECSTAFLTAFASAGWSVPGRSRFVLERMASSRVTGNPVVVVRHFSGSGRGHCLDRRGSDNRRRRGRRRDGRNDRGRICGRRSRWDRSRRRGDGRRSGIRRLAQQPQGQRQQLAGRVTSSARAMTGQSASAETKPTV